MVKFAIELAYEYKRHEKDIFNQYLIFVFN